MNNQEKLFLVKEANRLITRAIAGLQPGATKYQNLASNIVRKSEGLKPDDFLGAAAGNNMDALKNLAIGVQSVPKIRGRMSAFAGTGYDRFRNILESYLNNMPKR